MNFSTQRTWRQQGQHREGLPRTRWSKMQAWPLAGQGEEANSQCGPPMRVRIRSVVTFLALLNLEKRALRPPRTSLFPAAAEPLSQGTACLALQDRSQLYNIGTRSEGRENMVCGGWKAEEQPSPSSQAPARTHIDKQPLATLGWPRTQASPAPRQTHARAPTHTDPGGAHNCTRTLLHIPIQNPHLLRI